jgi:CRP-like cAMP-binding protein
VSSHGAAHLQSIRLFEGLGPDEIAKVEPIFSERSFPAHKKVIVEGEGGDEMFVLVSGTVRIVKSMVLPGVDIASLAGKDPSKVLATLTAEARPFFGEMGLVSDSPRSATVETLAPSRFLVTDRERFYGLVSREPELGCKLLSALCERMADMVRSSNAEVMKLTTALALLLSGRG